jgi:DnaJ-class molecular chaperone
MVVDTQLYDLLGVSPNATDRDLKKAFQLKALALHPDKNRDDPNATEKFQQLNHAYDLLKNPERRAAYDRYGPEGLREDTEAADGMSDIFAQLFGFQGFGRARPQHRQQCPNLAYTLAVTLEELYSGKEIGLRIERQAICRSCNGSGRANGREPQRCRDCRGHGHRTQDVRMGGFSMRTVTTCATCGGTGVFLSKKDMCKACGGNGVVQEKKDVSVWVEPGMIGGDEIVLRGYGHEAPDCEQGDVVVVIEEKKHSRFVRDHNDLLMLEKVLLVQALCGEKVVVTHIDGRKLILERPPDDIIRPGDIRVIEKEGMPVRGQTFEKGRLFVRFEVEFPERSEMNDEVRATLLSVLPGVDSSANLEEDDEVVTVVTPVPSERSQFEQKSSRSRKEPSESEGDDDRRRQSGCFPM